MIKKDFFSKVQFGFPIFFILFATATAKAFPSFDLNDLPFLKLEAGNARRESAAEYQRVLNSAVRNAVRQIEDPLVKTKMVSFAGAAFKQNLGSTEKLIGSFERPIISGQVGLTATIPGLGKIQGQVEPIGNANEILEFQVLLSDTVAPTKLFLKQLLIHESLGHLIQDIALYSKFGPVRTRKILSDQDGDVSKDFVKVTHTTAALMELQFYRIVPEKVYLEDMLNSQISDELKATYVAAVKRNYNFTPTEFIKFKARREACGSETVQCISDEEFEVLFSHFRKIGLITFNGYALE